MKTAEERALERAEEIKEIYINHNAGFPVNIFVAIGNILSTVIARSGESPDDEFFRETFGGEN